jgi:hypothetical protein
VQVQPRAAELVLVDIRVGDTDADPGRRVHHAVLVGKEPARATARSSGDDRRERDQGEEDAREDGEGHGEAGCVCVAWGVLGSNIGLRPVHYMQ